MPKVSVIVPVYNSEKYLDACLTSLLQQTMTNIEIICVDDGSTDQSYEILKKYANADTRVKVYRQENQGVAKARNTALCHAAGDWIAFCDSDDTVPLYAYEKLYAAAKSNDIVVGSFCDIDDYGVQNSPIKRKQQLSDFAMLFKVPCIWTKLIRRQYIVDNHLTFPDVPLGEDVIFLSEVAALRPRCKMIPDEVYCHWNHNKETEKSLNHKYDYEHFKLHVHCRDELLRICHEEANIKEAYYYVYHNMLGFLIEYLFRIQDFEERKQAFTLFKQHLSQYDWTEEQERFSCVVGMPYEDFCAADAEHFFTTTKILNHADIVVQQYQAGMLGFRYILKAAKAWAEYKIKRFRLEHK